MASKSPLSEIPGLDENMICAFELATGVCGLRLTSKVDAGTWNAIHTIRDWWHKPENANRSVTIGEASLWFAEGQFRRCQARALRNATKAA